MVLCRLVDVTNRARWVSRSMLWRKSIEELTWKGGEGSEEGRRRKEGSEGRRGIEFPH